jgi:hypothetical protein
MNPLVSTILLWERQLKLPPHHRYLARRHRFENAAEQVPTKGQPAAPGAIDVHSPSEPRRRLLKEL